MDERERKDLDSEGTKESSYYEDDLFLTLMESASSEIIPYDLFSLHEEDLPPEEFLEDQEDLQFQQFEAAEEIFEGWVDSQKGTYAPSKTDLVYEVDDVFGIGRQNLSRQEYKNYKDPVRKLVREQETSFKNRQQHRKQLNDIGYESKPMENNANMSYEKRLLQVLKDKSLSHMDQIPYQIQVSKENTALDKQKKPDHYEQAILDLFDQFEQDLMTRYLDDEEIAALQHLFVQGQINNLAFFHRFEQIRRKNKVEYYKRIFLYGGVWSDRRSTNQLEQEVISISQDDVSILYSFFAYENGSYEELGTTQSHFYQKIKASYKQEWKRYKTYRIVDLFAWENSGFYPKKLATFAITQQDTDQWIQESKKEFLYEYPEILQKWCEDKELYEVIYGGHTAKSIIDISNGLKESREGKSVEIKIDISNFLNNRNHLQEWSALDPEYNLLEHQQKTIESLKNLLQEDIQKLESKWKYIPSFKEKDRSKMSRKYSLGLLVIEISFIYKFLQSVAPQALESCDRPQRSHELVQSYISHFKEEFIQRKIASVCIEDTPEKVREKAIADVKRLCLSACKKHIQKKVSMPPTYNPLTKYKAISIIKGAFLVSGWSLVLKRKVVPQDKERKLYRQDIVQSMIEEIIVEIEYHLMQEETFSLEEYFLVDPLTHWYKKYGGTNNLLHHPQEIQETFSIFLTQEFENQQQKFQKDMEKILKKPISKENIQARYVMMDAMLNKAIAFVRATKSVKISEKNDLPNAPHLSIDDYIAQSQTYLETQEITYPLPYIQKLAVSSLTIEDVERDVPKKVQYIAKNLATYAQQHQSEILHLCFQQRIGENAQPGGRLQRICDEFLQKQFGIIDLQNPQQRQYLISLVDQMLVPIVIKDITEMLNMARSVIFFGDKEKLKEMIVSFLDQRKLSFHSLGTGDSFDKNFIIS